MAKKITTSRKYYFEFGKKLAAASISMDLDISLQQAYDEHCKDKTEDEMIDWIGVAMQFGHPGHLK